MVNGQKGFWITSVFQQFHGFFVFCIMLAIWNENLCCDINFICRRHHKYKKILFSRSRVWIPDTIHRTHTHIHTLRIFILYILCASGNCPTFQNILFGKWQVCCLRISFSSKCKRCIYTIRGQNKKKKNHGWTTFDLL